MRALVRNWKAVLAILLALAAVGVYFFGYRSAQEAYLKESLDLAAKIQVEQATAVNNDRYKDIQDLLEPATQAVEESRSALYEQFPVDMKEEDQLLYLLYLEESQGGGENTLGYTQKLHDIFVQRFGAESGDIEFSFGNVTPIARLSDAAILKGLTLTVYYHATYAGFKNMVHALATDERVTSIQTAALTYNEASGMLDGRLILRIYLLDSEDREYMSPSVATPGTGKDNIFD